MATLFTRNVCGCLASFVVIKGRCRDLHKHWQAGSDCWGTRRWGNSVAVAFLSLLWTSGNSYNSQKTMLFIWFLCGLLWGWNIHFLSSFSAVWKDLTVALRCGGRSTPSGIACYGHLDVGRRSTSSSSSFYPNSYESMSTTSSCISNISGCLASFLIRKGRYCDPSQHKQETSCSIVREDSQNNLTASSSRYQQYRMRLEDVNFRVLQRRCIQWPRSRGTGKFSSWSRA